MSRRRATLLAVVLAWIVSLAGGPTALAAAPPVATLRAAPGDGSAQPLFTDGFESGDMSQWTTRSGLVVQQDEVASGGFAARATRKGGPAYARLRLDPERSELFYRIRFKALSLDPQNPVTLLRFLAKQEESIASVFVQSLGGADRGVLGIRNDASGTSIPNGAVISTATWHELQVHLMVGGPAGQIEVWLDGTRVAALSQTASFGDKPIARLQLGEDGTAASYDIAFDDVIADVGYVPASMVPKPVSALITIETVPATPGITFALDDLVAQADQKGVAQLKVDRLQPSYRQHLELVETEIRPGVRVSLGRWYWKDLTHARAALETSYLVDWSFIDLAGQPVEPSRISSLTLKNSMGIVQTFDTNQLAQPQWAVGVRMSPGHGELFEKDVYYTVDRLVVDGTNVVNRNQQRFFPAKQQHWQIQLLFYTARFTVRDALFGFPVGSAVEVTYPDGHVGRVPLDRGGRGQALLPRGAYELVVDGPGLRTPSPMSLTRDQDAQLQLFTYLDAAVVVGSVSATALALLLVGRRRSLSAALARRTRTGRQAEAEVAPGAPGHAGTVVAHASARPSVGAGTATATGVAVPVLTPLTDRRALNGRVARAKGGVSRRGGARRTALTLALAFALPAAAFVVGQRWGESSAPRATQGAARGAPTARSIAAGGTPLAQGPTPTPAPTPSADATAGEGAGQEPAPTTAVAAQFQVFWEANGGLETFGHPISAEAAEWNADARQTYLAQYFPSQRLEYHPDLDGTPYVVQIGRLGYEVAERAGLLDTPPFQPIDRPAAPDDRCTYFPTTSHQVCGSFRDFWAGQGLDLGDPGVSSRESLALWGYPISEAFTDPTTGLKVQYFERAVFEYHQESAGTPDEVRLWPLGTMELRQR